MPISFTLRYAAPETVAAFQRGKSQCSADTAVDVFAFGIMCYELLTRAPYYLDGVNGQEVGEMLAGNKQLPHETMSETNSKRLGVLRGCASLLQYWLSILNFVVGIVASARSIFQVCRYLVNIQLCPSFRASTVPYQHSIMVVCV